MDKVKFVEDSLWKIWSDMVCLGRKYHFKSFKGCLSQILRSAFLNTLTHIECLKTYRPLKLRQINRATHYSKPYSCFSHQHIYAIWFLLIYCVNKFYAATRGSNWCTWKCWISKRSMKIQTFPHSLLRKN